MKRQIWEKEKSEVGGAREKVSCQDNRQID